MQDRGGLRAAAARAAVGEDRDRDPPVTETWDSIVAGSLKRRLTDRVDAGHVQPGLELREYAFGERMGGHPHDDVDVDVRPCALWQNDRQRSWPYPVEQALDAGRRGRWRPRARSFPAREVMGEGLAQASLPFTAASCATAAAQESGSAASP